MDGTSTDNSEAPNDRRVAADCAPTIVAASFSDRERARHASHELQNEGYHDTWIGIAHRSRAEDTLLAEEAKTKARAVSAAPGGKTRIESENWFMRFFGAGDESLHAALVRRGVSDADARAAGALPLHAAILTVDAADGPEVAARIIARCGGRLVTAALSASGAEAKTVYTGGANGYLAPSTDDGTLLEPAVNQRILATDYDDGSYQPGLDVDESTRLQLENEHPRVDKTRISRGEPPLGTKPWSEADAADVWAMREEHFIERDFAAVRSVNGREAAVGAGTRRDGGF
jgi:hypothetical protein